MPFMINSLNKYDIVVVKFPFASSIKYKARPAVVISTNLYHNNGRNTVIILAISSQIESKLQFEPVISQWQESGLLKPSIFKSTIATIEENYIIEKLGTIIGNDRKNLHKLLKDICLV